MSKIICDICGTTYQDTAECCPICGCTQETAAELLGADAALEETVDIDMGKGSPFSPKKKREIFDFDEVNGEVEEEEDEDEESYDEEDEEEEESGHNTFAVILLTVIIVALLAAAAFVFVKYFLPNMGPEETVPSTARQVEQTDVPTTEITIPCQGLVLTSGKKAELNPGGYFLLNVAVDPADTTDQLIFASADESIATVTEDGRITAVSEGETVIYITCGDIQLTCDVVCVFEEETVPPTQETSAETVAEETAAPTAAPDVELKIKKSDLDFMLMAPYSHQIQLECDLEPEDVEWSVEHSHIATVENGYVTALKAGTTVVTAKYGDQEIKCYVRCY